MHEIFTMGGTPYPEYANNKILPLLREGYRLPPPQLSTESHYAIMRHTWQEDPDDRPTFDEIIEMLRDADKQNVYEKPVANMVQAYADINDEDDESTGALRAVKNAGNLGGVAQWMDADEYDNT